MDVEFDPAKDAANIAKHGLSLARAAEFVPQFVREDHRFTRSELRYRAFGVLDACPIPSPSPFEAVSSAP